MVTSESELESLVGTTVKINSPALMNRGLLYTVEVNIDLDKLRRSLSDEDTGDMPVRGWIGMENGKTFFVVQDGNH